MSDAGFRTLFAQMQERQGPGTDVAWRLAWIEFRTLFHELIHQPVWEGAPATQVECLNRLIPTERFSPLNAVLPASQRHSEAVPGSALPLAEAFVLLERYHDDIAAALESGCEQRAAGEALGRAGVPALPDGLTRKSAFEELVRVLADPPSAVASVMLHGSLADGKIVDGYSDADVLCVIARPSGDGGVFRAAADWILALNRQLFGFNPRMHHGPMIAFASEFDAACEAFLPAAVLSRGIWLRGSPPRLRYRPGDLEALAALAHFDDYFGRVHRFVAEVRSGFDALWWASSVLLLPMLWHQLREGRSIYKRDCLERPHPTGVPDHTRVLRRVSAFRVALGAHCAALGVPVPLAPQENPGRLPVQLRQADLLSPSQLRQLGLTDEDMSAARALWLDVRTSALAQVAAAHGLPPPRAAAFAWDRPVRRLPRRLDRSAYDDARATFVARAAACGDVRAVFEFGEVGCPGLSDLDLCVVLRDGAQGVPPSLSLRELPEAAQYVLDHDPVFVAESSAAKFGAVYPLFGARQIWGEPAHLPATAEFGETVAAAALWIKNRVKYPDDLDRLLTEAALNARTVLAYLHSLNHAARSLAALGCAEPGAVSEALRLDRRLREQFLSSGAISGEDVFQAIEASLRASEALRGALKDRFAASPAQAQLRRDFVLFESGLGRQPSVYITEGTELAAVTWKLSEGWHTRESEYTASWNWCAGAGSVDVVSVSAIEVWLGGAVCFLDVPNRLEIELNGRRVAEVPANDGGFRALTPLKLPLTPGINRLRLISARPGRTPPSDGRTLAFAWKNPCLIPEAGTAA